jgi:3-hydroxyacyl-[acyl-carrier-protein] dehydratase
MDLTLPLDYAAIERILPHRYPFLLVDRITEFEVDKRIVGIKNVSQNERYLAVVPTGERVLPPTILTEAVAQVGAIMILAKPENRQRLIYFMGIERVRYRRAVHPGDVVVIEATVLKLRSRMGLLKARRGRGHDDLCTRAHRAACCRQHARGVAGKLTAGDNLQQIKRAPTR